MINSLFQKQPNGHTKSNPRRFQVLFRRNFDGQKIQVVFTYLFRCNFDGRKIHVGSTYFFDVISMVEKSALLPRTFFDVISMVEKSALSPRTFLMYFWWLKNPRCPFTYFFQRNFVCRKILVVSTYFFISTSFRWAKNYRRFV